MAPPKLTNSPTVLLERSDLLMSVSTPRCVLAVDTQAPGAYIRPRLGCMFRGVSHPQVLLLVQTAFSLQLSDLLWLPMALPSSLGVQLNDIAMDTLGGVGDTTAAVAQFPPAPWLQPVLLLAEAPNSIEQARDNEEDFQQLANDNSDLVSMLQVPEIPRTAGRQMASNQLESVLTEVNKLMNDKPSSSAFVPITLSNTEAMTLANNRIRNQHAISLFTARPQLRNEEKAVRLSGRLQRMEDYQLALRPAQLARNTSVLKPAAPAAPPAEVTRFPSTDEATYDYIPLPEPLRLAIQENLELLDILTTATVFNASSGRGPSIGQLSIFLDAERANVLEALKSVSTHLDPPGPPTELKFSSIIRMTPMLTQAFIAEFQLDLSMYHEMMAKWCLSSPRRNLHARELRYVGDNWAHHVCKSAATNEMCDALRNSAIPMKPIFRDKIGAVIQWLKVDGKGEASDLLSKYEMYAKERSTVVVGGMSMTF